MEERPHGRLDLFSGADGMEMYVLEAVVKWCVRRTRKPRAVLGGAEGTLHFVSFAPPLQPVHESNQLNKRLLTDWRREVRAILACITMVKLDQW